MTVTAQQGVFAFGPQHSKEAVAANIYKHRASDIDLSAMSDDRLGPPEVGGTPVPTMPYRAGILSAGGATIAPRLENTLGWLLYGAIGDVSTETGKDVFGTTVTGFNSHEFAFDTQAEGFVPWMTFYKEIPGYQATDFFGETYQDCKVLSLVTTFPNDGLIQTRVDVLGRMAGNTTQWTAGKKTDFANTHYEDHESVPIGSNTGGFLKIPSFSGDDLPVVGATVSIQNAPLDIRQEKVYGSPYIHDVTVTGRVLTVDMVLKWEDPALYRSIITGSTTGTQWTCKPWISDLDIYALSCDDSSVAGAPYQLRVTAPKVMYQVAGGISLGGNEAVMMRVMGTAIKGTEDYYTVALGNTVTSYSWPTPP